MLTTTSACDADPRPLRIADEYVATDRVADVRAPYDGALLGRVALADAAHVDRAVRAGDAGWRSGDFPQWRRAEVLDVAGRLLAARAEEFAQLIAREAGKPIRQARGEVARAQETLAFSAAETRRLAGELLPVEATAPGAGKLGFVVRVPVGVVAAITPFNFPLNLVAHKLGPALGAGNAVVLKPAPATPLTALAFCDLLLEAGVPPDRLHVLCGDADVGDALVTHERVAAVTFTGSAAVGWRIRERAPRKRVALELGSTAPLIVCADGDWGRAADDAAVHAFSYAGQSCISVQRILVDEAVAAPFTERLLARVGALRTGDPLDEATDVGPLIAAESRARVVDWIAEARDTGARVLSGGRVGQDGTLAPTVLADVPANARAWAEEVFGPVVCVRPCTGVEEAFALANATPYALQAGVYTRDLGVALRAVRELDFGGVLVNDVPTLRLDLQPYGGVRDAGNTREGPAYAMRELTEERFVSLRA